ncbi:metallophosphoesterase family protein [Candidatus Berkiella cookevillensis]|uniref:Calcineurin-like phosphoesterase superfamily domain protein n=1 Tax=Candidatus Berkiella cookevillensis TaxID=437022 RepID=A0A0Q9YKP8_9GAMM|nr:metallophosphoesterase [Candidatus Berkiella cookevillensis]MCS5707952.1 metallophosphoesterase family protein [Candidatus Berkiella cookevillensis]
MKLIWLTDIHLNFLSKEDRMDFYQRIIAASGNKILISGDIAEAPSVSKILKEMADIIQKPIYFVLGNHDYYHGQVDSLRQEMSALTKNKTLLHWLPISGVQDLGHQTILLGEDCWADGRYGDYANSRVILNDSRMINDLFQSNILGKYSLLEKMQQLADKDAEQLKISLVDGIKNYHPKKVIVLIHVPPFREACLHEGRISSDDFLPFFSSKATGGILMQIAQENTDIEFLVLCGHTHSKAHWQACDNLTVKSGSAEYTRPEIQEIIAL